MGSVYKIVEQGFRKEKSEAAKTIAPPLRIRPSREELDESEGERDDAPAENPGRPVKGRLEVGDLGFHSGDLHFHVAAQVGDLGFAFADGLQQVFLESEMRPAGKITGGDPLLFLAGSGFAERVVTVRCERGCS